MINIVLPELVVKDYDVDIFCKKYPQLSDLVLEMKKVVGGNFQNYLVNITSKDYKIGDKTCADTRYHFDGDYYRDNIYCIWCKGLNRTVFPEKPVVLENVPKDRFEQNIFLEKILKDVPSKEIDDQTLVRYTSQDPHKGVVCKKPGNRLFVRVMGSNYLEPKNYVKRN